MSLHEFDSGAGLESMLLHFSRDLETATSHSFSPLLDGYMVVTQSEAKLASGGALNPHGSGPRVPLAAKSPNVNLPVCKGKTPLRPTTSFTGDIALTVTPHMNCNTDNQSASVNISLDLSRPCTPFQPIPPLAISSPLSVPSLYEFLSRNRCASIAEPCPSTSVAHSESHLAPSLDISVIEPPRRSDTPSTRPLAIRIPASVAHHNSPYVPWSSPVRRTILRPMTPTSAATSRFSAYSRPYSRSGARAPEPRDVDDTPSPSPTARPRFLRLSKSLKHLRKSMRQGARRVKKVFKRAEPGRPVETAVPPRESPRGLILPPLPSPAVSCESSNSNTLADWLRDCERKLERATPRMMTLEEYDECGSWRDRTSILDACEVQSILFSDDA
ncbi:unnamed protein product [Mycena citricolor]|uniref:Uncharacterized protein n=1 Tax=Mycena citricolor TaxID=2018698 RepID=A0AAD2GXS6_9AGAR|nr:unnamed protein product [Mycena citricolor]